MMGGDFAGYVGKFSPSDGALIPLPLYLVPEDLREWGQEPSSLEILVSEETTKSEDDDEEDTEEIGKIKKGFSRKRGFTKKRKKMRPEGEVV